MYETVSPRINNNSAINKLAQLEDLLGKSENRADRLKVLNEQVRKQKELSSLKGQLFKAQRDYNEAKIEIQQVRKQFEFQIKEMQDVHEKQLKKLQASCKKNICKCQQNISEGPGSTVLAFPKLPVLSYNIFPPYHIQSEGSTNIIDDKDSKEKQQQNIGSIASQNSQTSEEDPQDKQLELKNSALRKLTVSVRFNNEKAADNIRAITRSIVARDYESNCLEQFGAGSGQMGQSPRRAKDSVGKILFECKQVVSEEDFDEVLTDNVKEDGGDGKDISLRNQPEFKLEGQQQDLQSKDFKYDEDKQIGVIEGGSRDKEIGNNLDNKSQDKFTKGIQDQDRLSLMLGDISKKNPSSFLNLNDIIPHASQLVEISQPNSTVVYPRKDSFSKGRNSILINFNKRASRNSLKCLDDQHDCVSFQENKEIQTNLKQSPEMLAGQQIDLSSTLQHLDLEDTSFKLFEKFFVLGCEKEDMKEFENDSDCQDALLPGKILYSYPQLTDSPLDQILSVVHEFALPNGIASERIKIQSSFRKITDLILQNSKKMIQTQFFVFTMKSPTFDDHLSSNQPTSFEILNSVNPHRLLYCFCFKQSDYLDTTTNEEAFSLNNRSQRRFWKGKKVYCFVSYFPFYELFQQLLINVKNQVKISRCSMYSILEKTDTRALQKVDGDCIKQIISSTLESQFQTLMDINVTDFNQTINIDTLGGEYAYKLGQKDIINTQSHKWSLALTLSNISLQDLIFIFTAFLLEQTLVFFSKSKSILTNTIHTFEQLIYPLSWPHPIIYLLPNALEGLLDSPVPIIMDNHRIYCANASIPKDILKQPPHLNNLVGKLQKLYLTLNPQGLLAKKPSIFNVFQSGKLKEDLEFKPKFISSKIEDQVCEIILNTFNGSIRQCFVDILGNLPPEVHFPQVDKTGSFDSYSKKVVECGYRQDRLFLQKFVKTQIFSYYIESHHIPK